MKHGTEKFMLKAIKKITQCSKIWNVFILHQYDPRGPLSPFLISAAPSNSIWENICYCAIRKRSTDWISFSWSFCCIFSCNQFHQISILKTGLFWKHFFHNICFRTCAPEDCTLFTHSISVNIAMNISNSSVPYSNRLCFQSFLLQPRGTLVHCKSWRLNQMLHSGLLPWWSFQS